MAGQPGDLARRLKAIKAAQDLAKARAGGAPGSLAEAKSSQAGAPKAGGEAKRVQAGAQSLGAGADNVEAGAPKSGMEVKRVQAGAQSLGTGANNVEAGAPMAGMEAKRVGAGAPSSLAGALDWQGDWSEVHTGVWCRSSSINLDDPALPKPLAALYRAACGDGLIDTLEGRLWFDTETTGLSGGAGTHIFLMGWSRLVPWGKTHRFEVVQYFLADFPWEPEYIQAVDSHLASWGAFDRGLMVSYNGASFDLPLIRSRWTLNGIPWIDPAHRDCLHPARRLWKHLHDSCSLSYLETKLLGIERHGDPGGAMVPVLYFAWLKESAHTDFRTALDGVLEHHRQDLLSLWGMDLILESQTVWARKAMLSGSGLAWNHDGSLLLGQEGWRLCFDPRGWYQDLLKRKDPESQAGARMLCAWAWKSRQDLWWGRQEASWRVGEEQKALYRELWERFCDPGSLRAWLIALEHREKNPSRARDILKGLLDQGGILDGPDRKVWEYRLERLIRKSAVQKAVSPDSASRA